MERLRRNSVFIALHGTLGRDLVFRHYTNKVVVAWCHVVTDVQPAKRHRHPRRKAAECNDYPSALMCDPNHKQLYEKYLREGENAYKNALKEHFEGEVPKPSIL
jgi:hypothetical protein